MDIEVVERDTNHVTIKKADYNRLLALANEPVNNMMSNLINTYREQQIADGQFRDKIYILYIKDHETIIRLEDRINKQSKIINTLREINELYEKEWGIITFFRKLFFGTRI